MKDAGLLLFAHFILGFAHQCAIILVVPWSVSKFGSGSILSVGSSRRYVDETRRIVKSPMKCIHIWVGNYIAEHIYHLPIAYAQYYRLCISAHGHICNTEHKKYTVVVK